MRGRAREVGLNAVTVTVITITQTYNFEVADWHTYFVGEDGILVHNGPPDLTPSQARNILLKTGKPKGLRIDLAQIDDPINIHIGSECAIRMNGDIKEGSKELLRKTITSKQRKFLYRIKGLTVPR